MDTTNESNPETPATSPRLVWFSDDDAYHTLEPSSLRINWDPFNLTSNIEDKVRLIGPRNIHPNNDYLCLRENFFVKMLILDTFKQTKWLISSGTNISVGLQGVHHRTQTGLHQHAEAEWDQQRQGDHQPVRVQQQWWRRRGPLVPHGNDHGQPDHLHPQPARHAELSDDLVSPHPSRLVFQCSMEEVYGVKLCGGHVWQVHPRGPWMEELCLRVTNGNKSTGLSLFRRFQILLCL